MDKVDLVTQISLDLGTLVSYKLREENTMCHAPFGGNYVKVLNSIKKKPQNLPVLAARDVLALIRKDIWICLRTLFSHYDPESSLEM